MQRVSDFRVLGPKRVSVSQGIFSEEEAEGRQEPEVVNDSKETMFSAHMHPQ